MEKANLKRTAENALNTSSNESLQRPRAPSSDPQPLIEILPNGIVFFSLMNSKKNYFVPSTKNYFGGMKVAELKSDSGCNTMLLPILDLDELFNFFF